MLMVAVEPNSATLQSWPSVQVQNGTLPIANPKPRNGRPPMLPRLVATRPAVRGVPGVEIVAGPQPIGTRTMVPRSGARRMPRRTVLVDAVAKVANTALAPVSITDTIWFAVVAVVVA